MKRIFVDQEFDREVGGGRRRTYPAGRSYDMPDDHASHAVENGFGRAVENGDASDGGGDDGGAKSGKGERRARASGSLTLGDFDGGAGASLSFPVSPLVATPVEIEAEGESPAALGEALANAVNAVEGAPVTASFEAQEGRPATVTLKAKALGVGGNAIAFMAEAETDAEDPVEVTVTAMAGGKGADD